MRTQPEIAGLGVLPEKGARVAARVARIASIASHKGGGVKTELGHARRSPLVRLASRRPRRRAVDIRSTRFGAFA
jgi:hypothetical protein